MKLVRCQTLQGDVVRGALRDDGKIARLEQDVLGAFHLSNQVVEPAVFLPPVAPTAIWGIGLNYKKHAEEMGSRLPDFPVCFMKPPTVAVGHGQAIRIPRGKTASTKVDWECELAVVMGREATNVEAENALDYVAGYTCANDVSARDWQKEFGGSQWCRGKSFNTFCPLGPCLVTPDEIADPHSLRIQTRVNGEVMQDGDTSDMIFSIPRLIEFLSSNTTLAAGTVILTGTPSGVGAGRTPPRFLAPGDVVEIEISGIGVLSNRVE